MAFVNIQRRHLTESQRSAIGEELAKLRDGVRQDRQGASIEAPSISQSEAAELMNVSRSSIQRARKVREADPELAKKVKAGDLSMNKAQKIIKERERAKADPDRADDRIADDDDQMTG